MKNLKLFKSYLLQNAYKLVFYEVKVIFVYILYFL